MANMFNLYESKSVTTTAALKKGEVVSVSGAKCGTSVLVLQDGSTVNFHGVTELSVDNRVAFVFWRPVDAHFPDTVFATGSYTDAAEKEYRFLRSKMRTRNAVKVMANGAKKQPKLQRTDVWFAPQLKLSDFVDNFDLEHGFQIGSYNKDTLPETANEFLAGLAYDGLLTEDSNLPGMDATVNMVAKGGKLLDRSVDHCNWPIVSVKFDLFHTEKKALKQRAIDNDETFNEGDPLPYDSFSGKVWADLWSQSLEIRIGNTVYKAFVQSAAHAKVAQARAFFIRSDLFTRGMEWLMAGMDYKTFTDKKGFIKPFFYFGLMFTGLTRRHQFEEMKSWWARTVVLPDLNVSCEYDAIEVTDDCALFRKHWKGEDKMNDGSGFGRSKFFDFLRDAGLEANFCQCRMKPNGKGVLVEDLGGFMPTTGTVEDVWHQVHNWEDVDIVLTESFFKGACAYSSWEDFLQSRPTFGWNQPAANARTLNGQSLDTLQLNRKQLQKLASEDMAFFSDVVTCVNGFNTKAMSMAMKQLAMEGFTPADWMETDTNELAKRLHDKMESWEHGFRRGVNTLHFSRPNSRNLYLACDYACFLSGGKTRLLKDNEVNAVDLPKGWIVVSRNPQAAAVENCKVYNVCDKSWGVPGMLHVAAGSATAAALSGADFDGDQVLASSDTLLMQFVDTKEHNVPLVFKTNTDNGYTDPYQAAFAEMQNVEFQAAAQNAARALLAENAQKFDDRWAIRESMFWSAYMQVAVDAGKYGYKLAPAWTEHKTKFGYLKLQLPGWKYTKSEKYGSTNRVFEETKAQLELANCEEVSDHEVYVELLRKYMLSGLYAADGKTLVGVYDPKALIPEVKDGKRVRMYTQGFSVEQIAEAVDGMADVYKLVWARCGNANANVDAE